MRKKAAVSFGVRRESACGHAGRYNPPLFVPTMYESDIVENKTVAV